MVIERKASTASAARHDRQEDRRRGTHLLAGVVNSTSPEYVSQAGNFATSAGISSARGS